MLGVSAGAWVGASMGLLPREIPWFPLLFGSLAPDLDEPSSFISRPGTLLKPIIPRALVKILDGIFELISKGLHLLFGHRGLSHSILLPVLMGAAARGFNINWLFWFAGAYALHVLLDLCTHAGVPLFSPVTEKDYSLHLCSTGSLIDTLFLCAGASALIALCVRILVGEA